MRRHDFDGIASFHRARAAEREDGVLDDRTWQDLNMDEVFAVVDRTESAVGQQLLYARLRTAPAAPHLAEFDALASRFSADPGLRERVQRALRRVADPAAFDLHRLPADRVEPRAWHAVFPVLAIAMVAAIALVPFQPAAIFVVIAGLLLNLALRSTVARELRMVIGPFRQLGPLLSAARALRITHTAETSGITEPLARDLPRLSRLRRIASWAGRETSTAVAGNLAGLAFEYLNFLLFLDANALFFGSREVQRRAPELLRVLAAVGEVDAALSVASFRAGQPPWTRPVFVDPGQPTRAVNIRHPLVPDPVPNSLTLGPPHGALITGSNMSGKSTFLRTLGVAVVLAQTIDTVLAETYESPVLRVRSCIGRADDPATGRSYYLAEVDAVLGLVQASRRGEPHLFIFDELFRGTNAVERIAAGEAVLKSLVTGADTEPRAHLVVAATHDVELVDLLASRYASFHFADEIDDAGLRFDYLIRPGSSTTRNAIALLRMRGAPADLVDEASRRADRLDRERARPL
jgi:hypothetical protein